MSEERWEDEGGTSDVFPYNEDLDEYNFQEDENWEDISDWSNIDDVDDFEFYEEGKDE